MHQLSRRIFGVTAVALLVSTSTVWAQQAPPVRVRGTIEKVDGDTLTVKTRAGETTTVKLADNVRVAVMLKATLADIKPGSFIGVTAMPQPDGAQKAIGIHIFMESQKGVVQGRHSGWDREPGSTMTNANVDTSVSSVDGQVMMVKYPEGEKKVVVPPNTPIVAMAPGSKAVGRDGAAPPM